MKSYFVIAYQDFIINCCSIRNQIDAICTIIKVTQYLNVTPYKKISCKQSNADIIIWVDKMSRLFLNSKDKIHCFNYPFIIQEQGDFLHFYCCKRKLDGMSMSIIMSILEHFDFIKNSIENMFDCFFEIMEDFSVKKNDDIQFYWNLLIYLITIESGYLRYDHDESFCKNNLNYHPTDHIDFFYSSSNTFKIGLKKQLTCSELREIVDINDICYCLSKKV